MTARDFSTNKITDPTPRDKDGKPTDPHIATGYVAPPVHPTEQSGYAQGGTTNPPEGWDGLPRQLDNDKKPIGQRSPASTFDTVRTVEEVFPEGRYVEASTEWNEHLRGDPKKPAKVDTNVEAEVTDLTDSPAHKAAVSGDASTSKKGSK